MFQTLLESRAIAVDRRRRWTVASTSFHVSVVILVAAASAQNTPDVGSDPRPLPPLVFIRPPVSAPLAQNPSRPGANGFSPRTPTIYLPAMPRFGPIFIDDAQVVTPELFTPGSSSHLVRRNPDTVLTAGFVDRQVVPRGGNGQPRYPEALRASSAEGDVLVRFVVDTLGHVEPGSVTIVASTHALFAAEVRTWLVRTRYSAAEYEGRVVRQLVEQRFQFALRR